MHPTMLLSLLMTGFQFMMLASTRHLLHIAYPLSIIISSSLFTAMSIHTQVLLLWFGHFESMVTPGIRWKPMLPILLPLAMLVNWNAYVVVVLPHYLIGL
jgi:hypothetical protein